MAAGCNRKLFLNFLTWNVLRPNVSAGVFDEDGQRRRPAFVLLFAAFDETKSWYGEMGERISREKFKRSDSRKNYHTVNGYINSTLPGKEPATGCSMKTCWNVKCCWLWVWCSGIWSEQGLVLILSVSLCAGLTMCQSRDPVSWHIIGMGTAPEIHSIRFQDHSLQVNGFFKR